jgi:hypothetical protein
MGLTKADLCFYARVANMDLSQAWFVETGTYMADTILAVCDLFAQAFSIEIDSQLFQKIQTTFSQNDKTTIIQGDSVIKLVDIMDKSTENVPFVFFLDAHQSGNDTSNNGDWVPLLKELDIILTCCKPTSVLLVINDVRLFDQFWDWKGITTTIIDETIRNSMYQLLYKFIHNDHYVLTLHKKINSS